MEDRSKTESILTVQGLSKQFPGVQALSKVDFHVKRGEIHGLIGENGAGKSTFIKILGGAYQSDEGTMELDGSPYSPINPEFALIKGIAIVHQELSLCENMSVAENLLFNRHPNRYSVIKRKSLNQQAKSLLEKFELDISPSEKVQNLSLAVKEQVEILRALSYMPKLLILDEPSGPLSRPQVDRLFQLVRKLRDEGVSIIYISHNMSEVEHLCDRITVFRDGRYISTVEAKDVTEDQLANLMVGRDLGDMFPSRETLPDTETVMEVRNLCCTGIFNDISFDIRRGEIIGLYGLIGSGRTELALTIFGALEKSSGEIIVSGEKQDINSPKDAIQNGIAYLSEDRRLLGLFLRFSIAENFLSVNLKKFSRYGVVDQYGLIEDAHKSIEELHIIASSPHQRVGQLSGGNQQKALLAKWLSVRPEVLIIDEPTRGIDVGAKKTIYELLRKLADDGLSIIIISSELPEILGMSERILLMDAGSLIDIFDNNDEISEELIMNKIVQSRRKGGSFEKQ